MTALFPDWLLPTVLLLPACVLFFFGVGLPWALALLPRELWRDRLIVATLALALGPAGCTLAMLAIGTFGSFSREGVLVAAFLVALTGLLVAWRNRASTASSPAPVSNRLNGIDGLLIALITLAVVIRLWNTAYWSFSTYDEFWVYGYSAKIFMLRGHIPPDMGYYPQLLPLSYTFMQLMWGAPNDHAARVVIPYFALGSILLTYLLGARVFGRRVGLIAAAVWAWYPHHGMWSQFGDLEIPITLYFTGTALFFVLAALRRSPRLAVASGVLLGAALWTKPTAGALIQSFGLIVLVAMVVWLRSERVRDQAARMARYGLIALCTGAPIGGVWYVRNTLLGLPPLILPAGYWNAEAQRSGQELGWIFVLALVVFVVTLLRRQFRWQAFVGVLLLAVAVLPSASGWRIPTVDDLRTALLGQISTTFKPTPLGWEYFPLVAGLAILTYIGVRLWRESRYVLLFPSLLIAGFILPYFVTWFWSYSYHFRLSFAIVPLLTVLLAALVNLTIDTLRGLFSPSRWRAIRLAGGVLIVVLTVPGLIGTLSALEPALTRALPGDNARIARGNPALMDLVAFLQAQRVQRGRPLKIAAPGELRLPFFFPDDDIRTSDRTKVHDAAFPTTLDSIADRDFFIDSSVGQRLYGYEGLLFNQILRSLTRSNALQRVFTTDDGNFRFSVYEVLNSQRFQRPEFNGPLGLTVGDFAYLEGYSLSTAAQAQGEVFYLTLVFRALKPADIDYSIFIHIWDEQNQRIVQGWDGQPVDGAYWVWKDVPGAHFSVAYATRLWQPGEYVSDDRQFRINLDAVPGDYELRMGLYEPISGKRLPISKDGQVIGETVRLYQFTVLPRTP